MNKPTIAFDFDGVLHRYSKGWYDGSIYDRIESKGFILLLWFHQEGYPVVILSTRDPNQIKEWYDKQGFDIPCEVIPDDIMFWNNTEKIGITNRKIPSCIYIDDRGYRYDREKAEVDMINEIEKYIKGE